MYFVIACSFGCGCIVNFFAISSYIAINKCKRNTCARCKRKFFYEKTCAADNFLKLTIFLVISNKI